MAQPDGVGGHFDQPTPGPDGPFPSQEGTRMRFSTYRLGGERFSERGLNGRTYPNNFNNGFPFTNSLG